MLVARHGGNPAAAWSKARRACGESIDRAFAAALRLTRNRRHLRPCIAALGIEVAPAGTIEDGLAALSLACNGSTSQNCNRSHGRR
jgi:hypothetical protein